jgi:hypothetical protein
VAIHRRAVVLHLGQAVLLVPAGRMLLACGGGGGSSTPLPSGTPAASELSFTSSVVGGHQHGVTLEVSSLQSSPPEGVTRTTTVEQGHSHQLTLSEADLDALAAGQTLTLETSLEQSHTHAFELRNAVSSSSPGPTGGGYP